MDRITNDPSKLKIIGVNHYEANKSVKKREKEGSTDPKKFDTVSISQESRSLLEKVENLKTAVNEISDTRNAKIKEVKEKLETGFYEKDEIAEEVADKLIDAFKNKA
ncbi:MAG: flagellar biosynthesis anti-sigma factor FlgM [Candidatus Kuenenia sp.]|nr:flagellar biosynthesis anti-sigma factor FlgM [Candidatus Kuenenia hertensis]